MNIQEAKEEIKNTLRAYHLKDREGRYVYPVLRQRPILLMGPPGIGKTAILEQVTRECGVGLVAYTMTHHTRQSAVGLPKIEEACFGGETVELTRYTMSEIVAEVYAYMEKTGKQEGILFLDEVNCVSETLAPTMLQLLQNKTFGNHRVPRGWMIVAAGNPPEYNKSVREFDVATLDRVRTIPVEPNCQVWLDYARQSHVHGAIISYLTIRPGDFYRVEDRAEGKSFVTARGWEDLSQLLKSYEVLELPAGTIQVSQFLQQEEVSRQFGAYYQLYRKYDTDFGISALLEGELADYDQKVALAREGGFEERFTLIGLLLDGLDVSFTEYGVQYERVQALHRNLQLLKDSRELENQIARNRKSLQIRLDGGLVDSRTADTEKWVTARLEEYRLELKKEHICAPEPGIAWIKQRFSQQAEQLNGLADRTGERLNRAIAFAETCFGQGQELVLLITELAHSDRAMVFVRVNGSEAFLRHRDALLFAQQEKKLQAQCRSLMES